jgi:ketosteroid isomerase-like protein
MRSAADEIVSGIIKRWSASFNKLDAKALASLYSKNAFFFGSNPTLYRGHEGVAAYFNALPRWSSPTVQFTDVRTAQVNPDLINFAGTASFLRQRRRAAAVGQDQLGDLPVKTATGKSPAITFRRRRH